MGHEPRDEQLEQLVSCPGLCSIAVYILGFVGFVLFPPLELITRIHGMTRAMAGKLGLLYTLCASPVALLNIQFKT